MKEYEKLRKIGHETALLRGVNALLGWDQEVMMPEGAAPVRGEQMAAMAALIHQKSTGTPFRNQLRKLIDLETGEIQNGTQPRQAAALREWRHDYLRESALPKEFVTRYTKLTCEAKEVWRKAREKNKFHLLRPYLKKLVDLNRKKADLIGYKEHPYDALVDGFEPGMTTKEIRRLFGQIREPISRLVQKISESQQVDDTILYGIFPQEKQMALMERILKDVGFSKQNNRLDLSTHPFSSASHPKDSRITTRVYPDSFHHNLLATLHEWGHSLYEMGLPEEEFGTPLGQSIGLAMHESQSRWWETRIGQSKGFSEYLSPLLKEFLGLENVASETLYCALNKVQPTFIRVEADEVTYPLHVILRFELEVALIEGSMEVKDIPEAWNTKMEQLLGIRPKTQSDGCLQDIHWPMGAFGYFPTYALGNIYAGQLFEAFATQFPSWEKKVAAGDFAFINEWLGEKVHVKGRELRSPELIQQISKKELTAEPYLQYLEGKYGEIYAKKW